MKTILVVDDNTAGRELVREVLSEPGQRVVEARHAEEALAVMTNANPDFVLLDLQLPFIDGYSLLKRIRRDPRLAQIRVVALTAYAMHGDRERALAAGFDEYITKPVHAAALREKVEGFLYE